MTHNLRMAVLALFVFAASAVMTQAQGEQSAVGAVAPTSNSQSAGSNSEARTSADETFELNITERRITRRDFEASTSVEAGDESARGLDLRVGVAVGAGSIDVLLRNVRGQVRFRATLDRVLDRINARRAPNPAP
ncbi:MAG: hypothetical protein WCF57_04555 [Pyrinomonadaceae bacterium]